MFPVHHCAKCKFDILKFSMCLVDSQNCIHLSGIHPDYNVMQTKMVSKSIKKYCQHICFILFTFLLNFLPHQTTAKGHIIRTLVTVNNTSKYGIFHQSIFNVESCQTILANCYCINFMLILLLIKFINSIQM